MPKRKRGVILTEFAVQVYADGKINWGGADEFLLWLIRHKPKNWFLAHVRRIQKFGKLPKRTFKG